MNTHTTDAAGLHKIIKIEALRGLAALYVLLHHALPHKYMLGGFNLYNFFRLGQEAVILFFLLSGFVIKYSFAISSDKSFKRYFFRRFFRLYIPLAFVMFIGYLIVSHKQGYLISVDLLHLVGNLLMLQDWADAKPHVFVDPFLGNNPLWSLAYEWWFYMLFYPFATFIKSDALRNKVVFSISIVAAVVYITQPYFPVRIIMYFSIWWTGVILAECYLNQSSFKYRDIFLPIVSLLAIISALSIDVYLAKYDNQKITFGYHPLLELRHFIWALIVVVAAIHWRSKKWILFNYIVRPFAIVAPISYTIYILHWYVMIDSGFLEVVSNPVLRWFSYLLLLLALSYIIEIIMYPRLRKRFSRLLQ